MTTTTTQVNVGKYKFNIIDNIMYYDNQIYIRNCKIGGNYDDCVNISIQYQNGKPHSASMPILVYDEECSLETPLEKQGGSVTMIKTLLNYVHRNIPEITEINFDDTSNIDCATEEELVAKTARKRGTAVKPIPLYYFSMAFNGVTWYEKHFNAKLKNNKKHKIYRETLDKFLNTKEMKPSFEEFRVIASVPVDQIEELQAYYENANTYGDFFNSIPKKDRCRLVQSWIGQFMTRYMGDAFQNYNWMIELPLRSSGGGGSRKSKKYYCPIGKINRTFKVRAITTHKDDV